MFRAAGRARQYSSRNEMVKCHGWERVVVVLTSQWDLETRLQESSGGNKKRVSMAMGGRRAVVCSVEVLGQQGREICLVRVHWTATGKP